MICKDNIENDKSCDDDSSRDPAQDNEPSLPVLHPSVLQHDHPHQDAHDDPGQVGGVAGGAALALDVVADHGDDVHTENTNNYQNSGNSDNLSKCWRGRLFIPDVKL